MEICQITIFYTVHVHEIYVHVQMQRTVWLFNMNCIISSLNSFLTLVKPTDRSCNNISDPLIMLRLEDHSFRLVTLLNKITG